MFERPHHQRIGLLLYALDGALLRRHQCFFGGGTAIALRHGEYRESVDVNFLISHLPSYRELRQLLRGVRGLAPLGRAGAEPLKTLGEVRADQYGIRAHVDVGGEPIKFEIVLEARILLLPSGEGDELCGVPTLTPLDMAASKLLANSDRWADDGVFSRDLIDLAMMKPPLPLLRQAVAKAQEAYGASVLRDLDRAISALQRRPERLERCMKAMAMTLPRALLWQNIRALRRVIPAA
jgi:hypothetical protein